jgi:hypothetical protein
MTALLDVSNAVSIPSVLSDVGRGLLPAYSPTVLSGAMAVPPSRLGSVSLTILISDFNLAIDAAVLQLSQDEGVGEISMRMSIPADVEASVSFAGRMTQQGTSFEIKEVSFQLAPIQDGAQADFVASTLNAALTLSDRVHFQMPEMGLDLALGFELPLIEIGRLLQSRQTSYRLMAIERATGIRFDLPQRGFSGTDIAAIIFVFRAIVDRAFSYHLINGIPMAVEANEEGAKRLQSQQESGVITFGPEDMSKSLLDVEIPLGRMTVKIQDPYIEDIDRVREEVAQGDGHPVTVMIRSRTNQALFELPEAPRLPREPWNERIQALINLEKNLDRRLVEQYHALAASTLAGLTEEERTRVTRRVELDDDAFLIDQ